MGEADLPDTLGRFGGVATEQEDIQNHVLTFEDFAEKLTTGALPVGPLALAGYWLMAHRPRLLEVASKRR